MRLRHTFAAAPLLAACLLAGASWARAQTAAPPPEHALKVTAEIVGQKYCAGAGGVDFLNLRLLLRYANAGTRRLIVYRGGNLFYQVVVYPAQGATAARYELRTTSARYATREPEPLDTPRPNSDFVTLAPGGEFRTEVSVTLPVTPAGAQRVPNTVGAGGHALWLRVSTWYESKPLAERLRERWARTGHLWTTPVSITPISFNAESLRSARACPGESPADLKRD